jgi:hypothetical protein
MAEEQAPQGQAGTADDVEAMARLQEQINNLPVSEHLVFMLHSLSALAIDRLGLAPAAAARRDPGQARMAIDAFKSLLEVLEPGRPAGRRRGARAARSGSRGAARRRGTARSCRAAHSGPARSRQAEGGA